MDFLRILCLSGGCGGLLAALCLRAIEIPHSAWERLSRLRRGEEELSPESDLRLCLGAALIAQGVFTWHLVLAVQASISGFTE